MKRKLAVNGEEPHWTNEPAIANGSSNGSGNRNGRRRGPGQRAARRQRRQTAATTDRSPCHGAKRRVGERRGTSIRRSQGEAAVKPPPPAKETADPGAAVRPVGDYPVVRGCTAFMSLRQRDLAWFGSRFFHFRWRGDTRSSCWLIQADQRVCVRLSGRGGGSGAVRGFLCCRRSQVQRFASRLYNCFAASVAIRVRWFSTNDSCWLRLTARPRSGFFANASAADSRGNARANNDNCGRC